MNWRGIKRRLKRNPALLDMNYRALPGTAEAMARSMRVFSEMAETVRLRASLPEERRNMLAHAINPEPRSHRRRACAMLSCALAVILLLATAVSGVFLPQEDVWIASRLAACQQNDEESASVRWHMRTGGGSVRCGWPWQDTAVLYEYALQDGEPEIQTILCVSVRGEQSWLFPFVLEGYTWSTEDGTLLLTLSGRRDYRLFEREYVWTAQGFFWRRAGKEKACGYWKSKKQDFRSGGLQQFPFSDGTRGSTGQMVCGNPPKGCGYCPQFAKVARL